MAPRDSEADLRELVAELEATLSALRAELDDDRPAERSIETRREADAPDDRRSPRPTPTRRRRSPSPPSLSELFRFTEQYTLPTLIATLEATIQSLELLRGALRLADPERSAFDGSGRADHSSTSRLSDGVAGVGRGAVSGVERALSELQTALSESELPEDETSRTLLEDARQLSEEVSDRLAGASSAREADRYGYRREDRTSTASDTSRRADETAASGGVEIAVRDSADSSDSSDSPDSGGDRTADPGDERDADESPQVDVEAELASIKDEVDEVPGSDDTDRRDESGGADKGDEGGGVDKGDESGDADTQPQ
ncbi:DUF7547 family protein [Halobellus captivus]|uniref:DUF7547 family protein n=1 Tax=Halobellus captivus TaxID=2592614 RepID=UPI0011A5798A|nr:hypothetical protein [Halobellus captivus]